MANSALNRLRRRLEPLIRRVLHLYWRLARGMTFGVRGVVLDPAGRVFLVKHTYVSGWHLPGGGVEVGETAMQSLERELGEEGNLALDAPPTSTASSSTAASRGAITWPSMWCVSFTSSVHPNPITRSSRPASLPWMHFRMTPRAAPAPVSAKLWRVLLHQLTGLSEVDGPYPRKVLIGADE